MPASQASVITDGPLLSVDDTSIRDGYVSHSTANDLIMDGGSCVAIDRCSLVSYCDGEER